MITLFSGGGLLEAGLGNAALPLLAVDYDPQIAHHYRRAWGDHVLSARVEDVDFDEVARAIPEVDYLHASPVCKNASKANKWGKFTETPSDVSSAMAVARAIRALEPTVVTIENVSGYVDFESFKIIIGTLEDEGYNVDYDVYRAQDFGAATKRDRLFVRASKYPLPPKPVPSMASGDWFSAIEDIADELRPSYMPDFAIERLEAEGVDWENVSPDERALLVAGGSSQKGKIPFAFAGRPGWTIKATGKEAPRVVFPGGEVYECSPRCLARMMGLPDSYPLPHSVVLARTIVGNGIPVPLTRAIVLPLLRSAGLT
jgi:DNA (cytosine-5)-methyltransferase 1